MGALHRRGHTQRIPAWPGGARQRRNCGRRAEIRGWRRAARVGRVRRGREAYYFVSGLTATSLENDVVVAVIPEADVAFQRTRTSLRLEAEIPGRHGLAFRVIGYFDAVQVDDGVRS